jgi:ADP-heptose:LPS heptosyltransferase
VREWSIHDAPRERIVCIFPGALGDWLLALPALRALRERHPQGRCSMVVAEALRGLALASGGVDETIALEDAETARLFGGDELPRWLADRPIVYSWLGASDPDARRRIARAAARSRFFSVVRGPGSVHAAVVYARAVGAPSVPRVLARQARLSPPPSPRADALLAGVAGPVLVVQVGAGARAKRWDPVGFVQLAEWWRREGGAVVEIAGPAEAGDAPVLGAPLAREWPLPDLAALLARAALVVGHDSGVAHLAGAVDAAGVVLFGPTDPERWRPLGRRIVALRAHGPGADGITLDALPVARVIEACRRRVALTTGNPEISVDVRFRNPAGSPRRVSE